MKKRLDVLLVERGLAESRERAQALVAAGEVLIHGRVMDKPGAQVDSGVGITIREPLPYVSRGGYKLAGALDAFGVNPSGMLCADIGASTGGFTDVLLQRGAARVYAADVGYGQLAWKLRQDSRVVVMDRINARFLENLPEPVALVVIDVSFISLELILRVAKTLLTPSGQIIALVKPQFEAGPSQVGRGGIVRDPNVHRRVLEKIVGVAENNQLHILGIIRSPILGTKGNVEFFIRLSNDPQSPICDVSALLDALARDPKGL
ncbi:MAG: TlyA family RNA methyltransferase [Chloroflexi bacterium]|nr:TlyA family RNA methyltransferase [Chloroflexota bacterium]